MPLPELNIGHLTASLPIIQGGMGVGISLSGLAAAVASAGGIGVIAAAAIGFGEPDFKANTVAANSRALRKEIRKARAKTNGILGVNIMVALSDYEELVASAVDEGIDIIFSGAGLPMSLPKYLKEGAATLLAPIVSSGRAAQVICKNWLAKYGRLPDAVVVEGPKAGGHLGFKPDQIFQPEHRLEQLVPEVVSAVAPFGDKASRKIPVIAAGGVYSGADIYKFLNLGASGVQMGTRFVATVECDASERFKEIYLKSTNEDLTIVSSPVGMPGRALRNKFIESVEAGKKTPFVCPYHCLKTCDPTKSPYCIVVALINAQRGNVDNGLLFTGANVAKVDAIVPVAELMNTLVAEYEQCVREGCPQAVSA